MKRQAGFTLIELLVVIGIIGLLATVLLQNIGTANQAANEFTCQQNLRNLGGAIQNYKLKHQGKYPKGGGRKFLWSVWRELEKSEKNRDLFFCPEVSKTAETEDPEFDMDPQEFWKQHDDVPVDFMSYAARALRFKRGMDKASEAVVADANQMMSNHKTGNTNVLYGDFTVKSILKTKLEDQEIWPADDPDFYLEVGPNSPHKDLKKLTIE